MAVSRTTLGQIDLVQMSKRHKKNNNFAINISQPNPLPRHLNERGRQYEEYRAIERKKREEQIQKLATSKAVKEQENINPIPSTNKTTTKKGSKLLWSPESEESNDNGEQMAADGVVDDGKEYLWDEDARPEYVKDDDLSRQKRHIPEEVIFHSVAQPKPRPSIIFSSPHGHSSVPQLASQIVRNISSPCSILEEIRPRPRPTTLVATLRKTPGGTQLPTPNQGNVSSSSPALSQHAGTKRKTSYTQMIISTTPSLIELHAPHSAAAHSDTGPDSEDIAPAPKQRVRDYAGSEQCVIKLAQEEFQVRICTEYAFPEDRDDLEDWIAKCWHNACDCQGTALTLTQEHIKLIRKQTSTIRGCVKDKAVARVSSLYGFHETMTDEDIQFNKQHAIKLLTDMSFIYLDTETWRGMYEHPILQAIINTQFFGNKLKSDGVVFSTAFNPISDETIALVFTAVQFVITQWATNGTAISTGFFQEETWHPIYKVHLDRLRKWRDYNDNMARAMARLKQRLFDTGRLAGFKQTSDAGNAFSDEMLAQAAAALD